MNCKHESLAVKFRNNGTYNEPPMVRAECCACGEVGPYRKTNHGALQALRKGLKK